MVCRRQSYRCKYDTDAHIGQSLNEPVMTNSPAAVTASPLLTTTLSMRNAGAMLLLASMWGLSIPITKLGLETIPPLMFTAMRFLVAVPLLLILSANQLKVPWKAVPSIIALGVMGITLGNVAQTFGVQGTSASVGTIVSATIPIFIVVFAALRFRQPVAGKHWAGLLAAFGGIALVAVGSGSGGDSFSRTTVAGCVLLHLERGTDTKIRHAARGGMERACRSGRDPAAGRLGDGAYTLSHYRAGNMDRRLSRSHGDGCRPVAVASSAAHRSGPDRRGRPVPSTRFRDRRSVISLRRPAWHYVRRWRDPDSGRTRSGSLEYAVCTSRDRDARIVPAIRLFTAPRHHGADWPAPAAGFFFNIHLAAAGAQPLDRKAHRGVEMPQEINQSEIRCIKVLCVSRKPNINADA